jgi:general secretion pathway protein G
LTHSAGISLVELVVTLSILSILASVILPSARMIAKRNKEIELRRNLRIIRNAIDDFKKTQDEVCRKNRAAKGCEAGKLGYPEDLEVLVKGHDYGDSAVAVKNIFLRRIPCDPFADDKQSCKDTWNVRSSESEECSETSGGKDLFDVCSKSEETAIDGTKYKDW